MRRPLLLCFSILLLAIGNLSAQSFSRFMELYGGKVIADIAHPTNTYTGCSYRWTDSNTVAVTVNYTGGVKTEVELTCKGEIFYELDLIRDTDFFPPFLASEGIKELLYSAVESEFPEAIQKLESMVGERVRDMNGRQLCCVMFTLSWLNYYARNS